MKQLLLSAIALLVVTACSVPEPSYPSSVAQTTATQQNTTAFDGTYHKQIITQKYPATCSNLAPSNLLVSNGTATLQGTNMGFSGYVTPDGTLSMHSISGQTLNGTFDSTGMFNAHLAGPNCAYDITWTRM